MEKANKRIIYEATIIDNAYANEQLAIDSYPEYSRYHHQNADAYRDFSHRLDQILGFSGQTIDEFISYVASITLSPEQKKALAELRKEPMFKKLIGETALQQKSELESVLGDKITLDGMTFIDDDGKPRTALKSEEQLDQESDAYSDKLSQLLSSGAITQAQYDSYIRSLDGIYAYYISQSKGEQIPFRKMTDKQYEQIEERAKENYISFTEQLKQESQYLQYEHNNYQKLQGQGMKR